MEESIFGEVQEMRRERCEVPCEERCIYVLCDEKLVLRVLITGLYFLRFKIKVTF